jgi:flagellar motor switch/type III secretory pathway protein FliN
MFLSRFWSRFCMDPKHMATTPPLPLSATEPPHGFGPFAATAGAEQALLGPAQPHEEDDPAALSGPIARLPVELDVAVPVPEFRVRNLLALEPGQVIETEWALGADMPLASGQTQLAWSEFEVIDSQLAVRVTRLV